jgi:16S rRNA (guanine527-N7)-methyltransferase
LGEQSFSSTLPAIADAGSGAGLPGIPLAIVLNNHPFTLIERMGRRSGFLRNTIAVLGLENVEVEQSGVEQAKAGRFTLVTFRAFRPLEPAMIKALFRLLTPQGVLAAYKARNEKIQEEMTPIKGLVGSWEAIETPVPFLEEERRLVVIRQR